MIRGKLILCVAALCVSTICVPALAQAMDTPVVQVKMSTLQSPSLLSASNAADSFVAPSFYTVGASKYPVEGSKYSKDPTKTPTAGTPTSGPHGGYDTASTKCATCHSVHSATGVVDISGAEGTSILRGATGCEYCHLAGSPSATAATAVYTSSDGGVTKDAMQEKKASGHYMGVIENVPASSIVIDEDAEKSAEMSCATCHMVHGTLVDAWLPTDFFANEDMSGEEKKYTTDKVGYKLLRNNPSSVWRSSNDQVAPVPNKVDKTITLSSDATDTAVINQFTMSVWCSNCHDQAFNSKGKTSAETTFAVSADNAMHNAQKSIAADYAVGAHANPTVGLYTGATQCYTCHRGGLEADPRGLDENNTNQKAVLEKMPKAIYSGSIEATAYPVSEGAKDAERRKCSRCHYGYVSYVADVVRIASKSDWPHSSEGDKVLLGNWTAKTTTDDLYSVITSPTADMWTAAFPVVGTPTDAALSTFRSAICGRCHITTDGNEFARKTHGEHGITLGSLLGSDDGIQQLTSPGFPE